MRLGVRRALHRTAVVLTSTLAFGATGLLMPSAAQAQAVESGSLSFSGDYGDYISGGQSHAYAIDAGDALSVSTRDTNRVVNVSVAGANGDWWYLDLAAPSGQVLAPGEYTGATRYPFNSASEPGLSLSGNGRGCNTLTGSFTVTRVVFGPHGYLQTLDASFEQHCEGGEAAARGEVHIDNPAAPAELALGVDLASTGTVSGLNGSATVHGTVTCNQPVKVTVSGTVTQVASKDLLVKGSYSTPVTCTPQAPAAWTASAAPNGTAPFQKGDVEVQSRATATDPHYGVNVTVNRTAAVRLDKA